MENDIKTVLNDVDFLFCFKHFFKCFSTRKDKNNPLKDFFTELLKTLMKDGANKNKTTNGCFNYFVDTYLQNEGLGKPKYSINKRTLIGYYNKYVKDTINKAGEPDDLLKNLIAEYLGYKNYEDFLKSTKKKKFCLICIAKYKKSIIFTIIPTLAIPFFFYFNYETNNCIIWKEDHFEKSSCDLKNAIDNNEYSINIERFRKINVTSSTTFFINGKPIIWYGKNNNKKGEYFTDKGIHPKTLKRLTPITRTILHREKILNE